MKTVSQVFKLFLLAVLIQMATLSLYAQTTPVILTTQVIEDHPNTVDVTLQAYHFENMVSMQFVLNFDPDLVQFEDFIAFNLNGLSPATVNFVPPGSIHFSWLAPNLNIGETLPDGAPVCTIRFTPTVQGSCSFLFDLDSPVFPEFVNVDFGFLDYLLLDCATGVGILSGNVFADQNANCDFDAGDPTLGNFQVKISSNGEDTYIYSSANGQFFYPIQPDDELLTVSVIPPNPYWQGCSPFEELTVINPGLSLEVDLGMTALNDCKQAEVELGTPFLRRCFSSRYAVSYCNLGTLPIPAAEIVVDFDPFLEVNSSSIPWSAVSGNTYTFPIGDLDIGECGTFSIWVTVSCDAELGQTHCSEATIYPIEFCDPVPGWDGAQLAVSGSCTGDMVQFEIENIGQQGMSNASGFIVIEDDMIKMMEPIDPLGPGESIALEFPATGSTWRVEVAQVPDFPVPSEPSAVVEACDEDGDGNFSMGFVNMFSQDEYASYVSVHCIENVGSWDPNDKAAFPTGYRQDHFITPETRLEYLIRFQNTGTDTAFNVVIRDTLSPWLDPATLRLQVSSHPCHVEVVDHSLEVHFPAISLPDSTTNELASHGFVQFSVEQEPDNPLGEVIDNRAAIYFDYNLPVITNQVFHTIGAEFVQDVSGVGEAPMPLQRLAISPNPARGPVEVRLPGVSVGVVKVCNAIGEPLLELPFQQGSASLERGALPSGLYWVVLVVGEKPLGVGSVFFE
ncbi:MAG: hypothetical protein H6563_05955 [Lewinellaceae bacterium]|nr:hypothetical protein [Lewinellaceae bacterium]